jgi:hypothetical protein
MGLFDKFTGESESESVEAQSHDGEERDTRFTDSDNHQADSYTREELSDEISIILADRWPTGKAVADYELVYGVDPDLPEPMLLKCTNQFLIPKGTKLLPFEDMSGVSVEGKTYWVATAQLINPELASFIDYDWEYKAPDAMEGRRIAPREPDEGESEFIRLLLASRQATREE